MMQGSRENACFEGMLWRSIVNILLVGSGAASLQTFKRVLKAKHYVTAVLSAPAPHVFRGASLVGMAEKDGVPVWSGTLVKDPQFADVLRSHHVDILLNINSLYRICSEVLEAPRIGAFNFIRVCFLVMED